MNLTLSFLVISACWIVSEIILAAKKRSRLGDAQQLDRSSQAIIWITILASITAGGFIASMVPEAAMAHRRAWALAGMVLIVAGLVIRWVAILTLKESFTVNVAIAPEQRILERGIYRLVRHPSYTGSLISFLGLGLSFGNWLTALVIFIPITLAFLYRVRIEEAALRAAFGDEYAAYASRTRRFLPFLFSI